MKKSITKVLIANRGAIACRIIRTLKKMGIASVAVYSDADAESLHVQLADEAVGLGGILAAESYLNAAKILQIAKDTGANAVHPGYGFLSENTGFSRQCEAAGIAFIGPTAEQIEQFGLKHTARDLAEHNGVPLVPGTGLLTSVDVAQSEAAMIGYPIMLKSTAGGGGIGMQVCWDADQLVEAFARVKRLSQNNFGNDGVFLEKYIVTARHIEIQVVGDGAGHVVSLGERDCSLQRRNQKVIEETPAPHLTDALRAAMSAAALGLMQAVNYRSAGTVEFIFDDDHQQFYFLEVNTRLQVEHGVTEAVTGIDLVEWMIRIAAGDTAMLHEYRHAPEGHAVQARLYAEDAGKNFLPSSGLLTHVAFPAGVRCDHWIEAGIEVPAFYDPMLAKIIVKADSRDQALGQLVEALAETQVDGIVTNRRYLQQVLIDDTVQAGKHSTRFLNGFAFHDAAIEVISAGTQTTVQDFPGRMGYWDIGVPPSGPMDTLAFRLGNQLLGNSEHAAGLEITLTGPTLLFRCDTVMALTGAPMDARLNGVAVDFNQAVTVKAGDTLVIGKLTGQGMRAYLAVKGGVQVADYLGSKSTFTLGRFGGHGGRALRTGDVLAIDASHADGSEFSIRDSSALEYEAAWNIAVIYGPHGAPDFFTEEDIDTFFATDWKVHFNSSRTGVRLIGPKPKWARTDGGEAGLHPSNIHDNAYAIGAVDFTGDMPVILGPDGPSLGGFVCPVTIIKADLWKMGQLKPGDTIRFYPVSIHEAEQRERAQLAGIQQLKVQEPEVVAASWKDFSPIIAERSARDDAPKVVYRVSGDDNVLVEYGPLELDLALRFRVHALMLWLQEQAIPGIIEMTPGIRSLQIHYDNLRLSQTALLGKLAVAEEALADIHAMEVPTRVVYLPLSWDDAATRLAIEKYMTTVRPDAPWCPSNIEFIRRINGLDSIEDVKKIVFDASYLVMGLGDVYLGAPVATPLDPRHRLVTTKYNPARTWTPENAVGIGGAYMCVYGMEGPGGYQFVGRTLQMWNRFRKTAAFQKPWLLRFFDQIRFYEVSADELLKIRQDFPLGQYPLRVEESTFKLGDYLAFQQENEESISGFRAQQRAAFGEERSRWAATESEALVVDAPEQTQETLLPGQQAVEAPVTGSLWQMAVKVGDVIKEGQTVAIIESMKMEFPVLAPNAGVVDALKVKEGQQINAGQALLVFSMQD